MIRSVAGFSGGRKLYGIGGGSRRTIRSLHAPRIIERLNSINGQLDANRRHVFLDLQWP